MYIVAFNGPPESGKDTLAEMLADYMDSQGVSVPVRMESLSLPLRSIAYSMVGWTYHPNGPDSVNRYSEFKKILWPQLGVTGRQLMIDASEKFLKPTYGIGVMVKLLLDRNIGFSGVLLIRDSGFQIEVNPLIQAVGPLSLFVVNVHRQGKTFDGDSREWVSHPLETARQTQVHNNGTLDDLRAETGRIYDRLVNQYGWKL